MGRVRGRGRVRAGVRVGLWLGLGLGASESFIADCRQGICWDQLLVAGYRYTAYYISVTFPGNLSLS